MFNFKFFKIFAKNFPFNFATEEILIKPERKKILIVLDEIDRCEPNNIISTFTILKNYCLNIENVVFIVLLNEEVIKPIIQDYYKISDENSNLYNLFLEKITRNTIEIKNIFDFKFNELDFLKNNKILQNSKIETNNFIKQNLEIKNQRNILSSINDKSFAKNINIFNFLLKQSKISQLDLIDLELFELIQYFSLIKILLLKNPIQVNELKFEKILTSTYKFDYFQHLQFQKLININNNLYRVDNSEWTKNLQINLNSTHAFNIIKINYQDNLLYASKFNSSEIYKINISNGEVNKIADLGDSYIFCLITDNKDNLYVSKFNSSEIYKINISNGEVNKIADLGDSYIISLTSDYQDNLLYASKFNSSEIYKINISNGEVNKIADLGKGYEYIYLTEYMVPNQLLFFRKNISVIEAFDLYRKTVNRFIHSLISIQTQTNYYHSNIESSIFTTNGKEIIKSLYHHNVVFAKSENEYIISLTSDYQGNLYALTLNNDMYIVNLDSSNNFQYTLRQEFINKIFSQNYSNYFTFKNETIEKMNFLDFYFIKNKHAHFNCIYINLKNEYNNIEKFEIVKKILVESYSLLELEIKPNIVLILEYKSNKYKVIFDLVNKR